MMRPQETLAGVARYVGLEGDGDPVKPMIESAGRRLPGMEQHRTTGDAKSSIGRWRRDLPAEMAEACGQAVGPAMEAWGYASEHVSRPQSRAT
jgi:hypothetical protein